MARPVGTAQTSTRQLPLSTTNLTLLHQAPEKGASYQRVTVWATNVDASTDYVLTLFFSGQTDPDDKVPVNLPYGAGPVKVIDGWVLERGQGVWIQAGTANKINVTILVTDADPLPRKT